MKNLINWVIRGAFVLLIVGNVFLYLLYQKASKRPDPSPIETAAKKTIETKAEVISKEVDEHGLPHTILKIVKEIDQSAIDKVNADLLDSVAQLNIARDKIRQVISINTNLSIKNQQLEKKVGELATTYSHKDDHLWLTLTVPKDSTKAAFADGGYDADLIATQYNKGSWLWGTDHYMDIYSNDPRFTIKGAKTLSVKQKQPFFGFNVQAVSEYNISTRSLTAGPSANVDFGRIRLGGKYLYDPSNQKWQWIATGGYRLIGN